MEIVKCNQDHRCGNAICTHYGPHEKLDTCIPWKCAYLDGSKNSDCVSHNAEWDDETN